MRVEFTYGFDDLREAHLAHQRYRRMRADHKKDKRRAISVATVTGAVVSAGVVMAALALPIAFRDDGWFGGVNHVWLKLLAPFVGFIIMMAGVVVIVRRQEYRGLRLRRTPQERKQLWRGILGLMLFSLLAVALILMLRAGSTRREHASWTSGQSNWLAEPVVVCAPWIVLTLLCWIFVWRMSLGKSALKKIWEESPGFLRPRFLEADDGGLVLRDGLSRNEHQWLAFTDFYEGTNLFLLYLGSNLFYIVPKRAFDTAELEGFRALLTARIQTEPPRGFQVLPVQVKAGDP